MDKRWKSAHPGLWTFLVVSLSIPTAEPQISQREGLKLDICRHLKPSRVLIGWLALVRLRESG